jgi:hypothetical protein
MTPPLWIVVYTLLCGLCWLLATYPPISPSVLSPFFHAAGWTFIVLVAAVAWFGRMMG